ncbi:M23 family metallopeptidase [Hyalangium rubrum]|uniref:M23 family metallopeptidase n=1 Tax=Hyalangium rubrum TaxID=3103134 RepID=A0ABU5H6Z5_9BACT|nr:M23 family metallopeptidase [Hyalangium sp. s54d21]MDY7229249.1 M23 family metallopeptidase [Hyalangium sp. s54d21]
MPRCLAALSLLVLTACATSHTEKVSFEEAFAARPESLEPPPSLTKVPVRRKPKAAAAPGKDLPTASISPELQAALASFVNRAREYRRTVQRGSAMPDDQVENWGDVTGALDDFLDRPAAKTSSLDIVRARVTLEAELEEDARTYGDIPAELAESVMGRVGQLSARMSEVRRLMVQTVREVPRFTWPLFPVYVTSDFGEREHPIKGELRDHLGVDLSAKRGQAILSAAPGVVLRAGWNGSHGYQVEVQHASRIYTRYSHLSRVLVEPGEILERGDVLGLAGDTGMATGVHLHFELWKDGQPMNPLDELGQPTEAVVVGESPAQPPKKHQGRRPSGRRP